MVAKVGDKKSQLSFVTQEGWPVFCVAFICAYRKLGSCLFSILWLQPCVMVGKHHQYQAASQTSGKDQVCPQILGLP